MEIEQVRDATTPEEMRAEIFRLTYYDSLVRSVRDASNYRGMSAEDFYTVLAYNALRQRNHIQALFLEHARCNPMPTIVMMPSNGASRKS